MAEVIAPALSPNLVTVSEYVRTSFVATIPQGIKLQSVLRPDYWAHCANKLKPYDRIECRAMDNAWYADLMVSRVEKTSAAVWVIHYVELNAQAPHKEHFGDYAVTFAPKHRWRVQRADGEIISKDHESESVASAWLADFVAGKVKAE